MKRLLLVYFISALILVSCSGSSDKERFMKTYKEILVTREMYIDSVKANQAVRVIIKRNGFTERSFFDAWKGYTSNSAEFNIMMDTIRQRAQQELIRLNAQKYKNRE